ncbi:hypothetical protein J4E83_010578 [Alternaria metachromatica]|uniref:uncharacterized protein n=1 Tax=Alternaria metachromatica TaxID=283354 RepID=UPI0020C4C3ED|nr:uncharacterized protein J4E83_010578 [Alternaria metachromatica]KAI4605585.1 hypothetical protein J4E83_010578 [Alternaria metachromatica]
MIDKLPAELTIDVMSYLRPHDLTQLTLTFRGMSSAKGHYWPKAGPDESLKDYSRKLLPGVQVNQILGNYMFFNTERGTILNQHGADGLKVHLEFDGKHDLEALYDSNNFTNKND